ncbi:MAG TPA: hypothetical protein VJK26_02400 [Patescibacteria group bacterium]|nr:hypothetical protein [Patescibacteria group bacterium]
MGKETFGGELSGEEMVEQTAEERRPAVKYMNGVIEEMPNLEETEKDLTPVRLTVFEAPVGTFSSGAREHPNVGILATKQELQAMQEKDARAFEFLNLEKAPDGNPYGTAYMTREAMKVLAEIEKGAKIIKEEYEFKSKSGVEESSQKGLGT